MSVEIIIKALASAVVFTACVLFVANLIERQRFLKRADSILKECDRVMAPYYASVGAAPNFLDHPVDDWVDLLTELKVVGLDPASAHELTERAAFARDNGGTIQMTPDGPRLDDVSETLFIVGRKVRS